MKRTISILLLCVNIVIYAQKNPAAKDFDTAGSHPKAIELADEVMQSMGGRKNWDKTRYLVWNFFGFRKHHWDKHTGDVRIDDSRDKTVTLMNINTDKGRVFKNGEEITQSDSLAKYLKKAKGAWINDSYWLIMPFKLKDSGVTLGYAGEGQTEAKEDAHILTLKFKNVGNTPQNGYKIWVSKKEKLVKQWAYFDKADNEKPNFILPWQNYEKRGNILITGDRGPRKLTEIEVPDKLDRNIFTQL